MKKLTEEDDVKSSRDYCFAISLLARVDLILALLFAWNTFFLVARSRN